GDAVRHERRRRPDRRGRSRGRDLPRPRGGAAARDLRSHRRDRGYGAQAHPLRGVRARAHHRGRPSRGARPAGERAARARDARSRGGGAGGRRPAAAAGRPAGARDAAAGARRRGDQGKDPGPGSRAGEPAARARRGVKVTALAAHTPEAVRAALVARGWDAQPAWFAATGMQPLVVLLEDISDAEREALVHWGAKAGADVLTGEGWALVGAAASRLAPLARPDRVPAGLERLGPELGRVLAAHAEPAQAWEIAAQRILLDHPVIIGIINVTPDSFSDGGLGAGVRSGADPGGRRGGGGRDPHAHARHARYHGFARHLPPRGGRGRRGARRGGAAG